MDARPNILWIVTTQWRAQACGYAGDPNARTPCLDALAAESVNYAQAVTPHPFGPFARAAMLTGVPSPQNGVRDYFDPLPVYRAAEVSGVRPPLQLGRTIAHDLTQRGYATAFFGKWHLAKRDPRVPLVGEAHAKTVVPPEARGGFGFWEGFEGGFLLNDPWLHGSRLPEPVRFPGYQSEVVCRRATEWIAGAGAGSKEEGAEERSWFAVVSLEAPHPPYDAPVDGVAKHDPRDIVLPANVPRGGVVEARARRELAGYYAHIEATDRAIGRLIAQLDAEAARRAQPSPIVVFTSVHGDMHGAHGLFRKGWPYEESVRVPLLVRLPAHEQGRLEMGDRRSDLVSLWDLPRWAMDWAKGVFDLRAASSGLRNPAQWISMPSVVALPDQCDRVWRGVRTAKTKLVLNADGSPWLCFDLENDPRETTNLVHDSKRAAEIVELRSVLDALQKA